MANHHLLQLQLLCGTRTHTQLKYINTVRTHTTSAQFPFLFPLSHTHTHTLPLSLSPLIGLGRGESKLELHCMFVYVTLSVILVAVQLRAVSLRKARLFKDHYEPCQQAAQLQHAVGPDRMNESSHVSRFITQGGLWG